jgi:hypothetical protein
MNTEERLSRLEQRLDAAMRDRLNSGHWTLALVIVAPVAFMAGIIAGTVSVAAWSPAKLDHVVVQQSDQRVLERLDDLGRRCLPDWRPRLLQKD